MKTKTTLPMVEWSPEDSACELLHEVDFTTEADMIKAIVSVADYIRKQSKWISVDERLPEHEFAVLVCVNNKVQRYPCYYFPNSRRWLIMDSATTQLDVTHWMEFPTPPAKDERGESL